MTKEKQSIKEQLEKELSKWQTKVDEAKVQMHLGVKDAEDQIKPHVDKLDQEMNLAKNKLEELGKSSEGAWDDLKAGVESSLDIMKVAFDSAQEHFTKDKK